MMVARCVRAERLDGLIACATLLCVLALSGCGATTSEESRTQRLTITGSSTVAPLVAEMAQRFESEHANVRIDVQTGGSARGIADARRGLADIGMVSRSLNENERNLHAHVLARDGIAMLVHRDNRIDQLTHQQIIDIYTGGISNWKTVGGSDAPITVVNKAQGRATLDVFLGHFDIKSNQIHANVVIGDNEQAIKTVAGNRHAIGYVSIGAAEYHIGRDEPIKLLPAHSIEASTPNVANGDWPISRELIVVTKDQPTGLTGRFVTYAQSSAVHDLIEALYFVPVE